jgi:hypothetical protein
MPCSLLSVATSAYTTSHRAGALDHLPDRLPRLAGQPRRAQRQVPGIIVAQQGHGC